ncbi:hypothetical protein QFX18_06070 [Saccharophagus degradans]|uniref:hypothetical protein n=1 Tax=Saccharophagus degradans TaxID=86304 RepID=UPI0024780AA4|nr:hypothetical protein [Saccharophagus degradans]WGO99629.1 hypothetical protein QFX18_06070 [Saccharophagus degradans]
MSKSPKVLPPFKPEEYEDAFSRAVHFSFKGVNTNAMEGGVRLSSKSAFSAPYICVQTLLSQGYDIECDYTKQETSPPSATVFKHLRIAKFGDDKESVGNPDTILDYYQQSTLDHYELNTERLSPRLRQVILPINNGMDDYKVTTPLPSAGMHKLLNAQINESNKNVKSSKEGQHIRRATMGFGGSNPQNAGSLIRHMQSVLFFDAPKESAAEKRALSLFYKGMAIRPDKKVMEEYFTWREAIIQSQGHATGDMANKEQEALFIERLCCGLMNIANRSSNLLQQSVDFLPPSKSLVSDDLDDVQRGLLDPEFRDLAWRRSTADEFAWSIANYSFDNKRTLGFSGSAVQNIAQIAEGFLR